MVGSESVTVDDDVFPASSFTLACLNCLKQRESEISSNARLKALCARANLLIHIQDHDCSPIHAHSDFFHVADVPTSFTEVAKAMLLRLHEEKCSMYPSVQLRCMQSAETFFDAHLPVLVYKSEFFYRMLHFGGMESLQVSSVKTLVQGLVVDVLGDGEMELYLELLYTDRLNSVDGRNDFQNLFVALLRLLRHAHVFKEAPMEQVLSNRIVKLPSSMKQVDSGLFERVLKQSGYLLEDDLAFGELKRRWIRSGVVSPEILAALIDESIHGEFE